VQDVQLLQNYWVSEGISLCLIEPYYIFSGIARENDNDHKIPLVSLVPSLVRMLGNILLV
jgi:hypothetical protein